LKVYPEELSILQGYQKLNPDYPQLDQAQNEELRLSLNKIRGWSRQHQTIHFWSQLLPYLVLIGAWAILLLVLPKLITNQVYYFVILFVGHGIIGYQWVIYGMHEGAGHGLFKRKKNLLYKTLNFLSYHSCRLFFADAGFYNKAHPFHHRYVGTDKDAAMTNFMMSKRVVRSMLPGAGIFFPNDYRIHKGDENSPSLALSGLVGISFLALEVYLLKDVLPIWAILLALLVLGPWIGLTLDRIRESIEHHLMPVDRLYGSRELGLSPLNLFIAGGPWGQPCHFCHHVAQDLTWYQQIWLHFELKKIMNDEQAKFYGFKDTSLIPLIIEHIKIHKKLEQEYFKTQKA
jgi:fatty acid desaturase